MKLTDLGLAKLAGLSGRELPQLWAPAGAAGAAGSPPPVPRLRSPGRVPLLGAGDASGAVAPPRPPLASLDLAGCVLLTERGFAAVASGLGATLTQLAIGGCSRVSTVSDAALAEVARCGALRSLDMSGCTHVTDDGQPLFWGGSAGGMDREALLGSTAALSPQPSATLRPALSYPSLSAAGVAHLSALHRLTSLSLWNCLRVSEGGLALLRALPALADLSLRGCQQLPDACLAHLAGAWVGAGWGCGGKQTACWQRRPACGLARSIPGQLCSMPGGLSAFSLLLHC